MKLRGALPSLGLLTALVLLGACTPPPERASPGAFNPQEVRAVLEAQRDAWNAGDLEGYMAGYERSEKLVFTSGAAVRRGWQETHDKYLARYGGSTASMGKLRFEIDEVRGLAGGQSAVVLGRWFLEETPQAGDGVFSVILERQAQGWKVVHDHTSATPPSA